MTLRECFNKATTELGYGRRQAAAAQQQADWDSDLSTLMVIDRDVPPELEAPLIAAIKELHDTEDGTAFMKLLQIINPD